MNIKRRLIGVLLTLCMLVGGVLGFASCELCEHEWQDATCTKPKTCSLCNKTQGEPLGHKGGKASCTEKATCEVCGETYGELAKHTWVGSDDATGKYCEVCGIHADQTDANTSQNGTAPGTEIPGTEPGTEIPGTGQTTGKTPCLHQGGKASCTEAPTCELCGEPYGEPLEHVWVDATCTAPKHCENCDATEGKPAEHDPVVLEGKEPTCTETGLTEGAVCGVCDTLLLAQEEIPMLSHEGGEATCTEQAICDVCGNPYGELDMSAHTGELKWYKFLNTHYQGYTCCGTNETEEESHEKVDGVCTVCGFDPTIRMEPLIVTQGSDTVVVTIAVEDNPGMIGLQLTLEYNDAAITLKEAMSGSAMEQLAFTSPEIFESGCKFLWDGISIANQDIRNGELLTLVFDCTDTPVGEYNILIKTKAYDGNLNLLNFKIFNGSITVEE